ncbi:serine/threonine protein kinase [Streptomyces sp. Ru73]|uniref:serine/threonine-protein kinase n=1 Tax=Streptomyces sp. Ru73 TaxID=2080748 RepID=UPI000CDDDA5E|nr:serine/threonine-protein kinase [Streptomyces sp. Ru73]POX37107.1 serine/threonine protein kinase [Streptomyces sp. Ru73]
MQPLEAEDPARIGTYTLLARLGAGGMGRVYLGRSPGGRTVAVKAVHPQFAADREFRARFRREVAAARRVGGAWTAPVLDADAEAAVPWVATAYVAAPSLDAAVAAHGPLPEHSVRALGAGLAEALAAVHGLGLVHRDVKPSNVLLTLDGPLLIDFGIARATDGTASLTATGVSVGSPGYMAPEQILGDGTTGASDVFSLGAVLAYAATGESPFPGDSSAALLYKVVHEEPRLGPELTGDLRALVSDCLLKRAGDRPPPAALARRLAGEGGAAALVRAGWLPSPVVEQVSRRAVEVLNLEAGAREGAAPVPGPAAPAAGFGPPDPSYAAGPGHPGAPAYGPGAAPTPPSGPVPFDAPAVVPPPREWPAPAAATGTGGAAAGAAGGPAGAKERRLTLTGMFGGRARPRRLSCTLVLSVAGALAVATTAAVVLPLLPGDEPKGGDQGGPAATPTAGPPRGGGPEGAVPEAFLGTWTGTVRQDDGTPNGSVTVTVGKGKPGEQVAKLTYDVMITKCRATGELRSATGRRLTLRETAAGDTGALCTGRAATVTLTREGDGLAYASDDADGGHPTAHLTRTG